jgi:hypothetical protein
MLSYNRASIFTHGFNHQFGRARRYPNELKAGRPIATVGIPLRMDVSLKEFSKGLRPIRSKP